MGIPLIPLGIGITKLAAKPTIKLAKKLVKKYKKSNDAVLKRTAFNIDEILYTISLGASGAYILKRDWKAIKKGINKIGKRLNKKNEVPTIKAKKGPIKYRPLKGYSSPNVAKPRTRVKAHGGQVKKKPKGWGKARYKGAN